jgi:hypothetical protein
VDVSGDIPAATATPADLTDAGAADMLGPMLEPLDKAALELEILARNASDQAAKAAWPTPVAIWPNYPLHKVPLYLVAVDAAGKPKRGYVIGFEPLPKDAVALPVDLSPAARWDGGLQEIGQGETFAPEIMVDGRSAVLATFPDAPIQEPQAWVAGLGEAVFGRVRAGWAPIVGCGQTSYPRFAESIALQVLEAAVLAEALTVTDKAAVEIRLKEWSAVRKRSTDVTPLVSKRWRHYDSWFGTSHFAGARLVQAAGLWPAGGYVATLLARLQAFATVQAADFDTFTLANGDPGTASIELATRLGWDVEPAFRDAQTVYDLTIAKWGPQPVALVEAAKKRHDWPAMQKLADEVMAIPGVDPAP